MRQCGECTLCCKLMPMQRNSRAREEISAAVGAMVEQGLAPAASFIGMMPDFDKPAGKPCPHQSHHRGCKVYERRPFGCRTWNCRWLVGDDTADLRRPDRSRYVIDIMPDFITIQPGENEPTVNVEVVQIWVEGDAWRKDKALLAYLDRRGREGKAALIRFNSSEALTMFPPSMSKDGEWHTVTGGQVVSSEHRGHDLVAGIATAQKVMVST